MNLPIGRFLGKGGLLLAGLGLLAGRGASGAATVAKPRPAKPIDLLPWKSLRADISGGVLRPGEAGYAAASAPWNPRYADLLPFGAQLIGGLFQHPGIDARPFPHERGDLPA